MKNRIKQWPKAEPDSLDKLKNFSDYGMKKYGPEHWILNESGEVIPASLMEWALWFERCGGQRVIQQDYPGQYKVSTVFTGLDMAYSLNKHKALVFETMVFGPEYRNDFFGKPIMMRPELWTERCATLAEALDSHKAGLKWLEAYLKEQPAAG